ncbi:MAG: hypothetical protein ACI9XZ_004396 [Alphaproteobacteria bacterium]|jgi:hypothetical protein
MPSPPIYCVARHLTLVGEVTKVCPSDKGNGKVCVTVIIGIPFDDRVITAGVNYNLTTGSKGRSLHEGYILTTEDT